MIPKKYFFHYVIKLKKNHANVIVQNNNLNKKKIQELHQ